jgi:hypothetical protein
MTDSGSTIGAGGGGGGGGGSGGDGLDFDGDIAPIGFLVDDESEEDERDVVMRER